MRLEHHGAGTAAFLLGDLDRRVQHLLMAAMDAVEIADGERRALESGRHVPPEADNVHHGKPSISLYWRGARRSTIITASPSSTVLPLTEQSQAKVARPFSGSSEVTFSVATTSSPIKTGALEFHALREVDAARARQLGAEHGGEQAAGEESMRDALLEDGARREIVGEMHRIDVPGKTGEGEDVLIGDLLGEARLHAEGKSSK